MEGKIMNWETITLVAILGGSFGLAVANLTSQYRRKSPPKEPRESFTTSTSEDLALEGILAAKEGIEAQRSKVALSRKAPARRVAVKAPPVLCRITDTRSHTFTVQQMADIGAVEIWIVLKYNVQIPQLADLECLGRCWHDGRLFEIKQT